MKAKWIEPFSYKYEKRTARITPCRDHANAVLCWKTFGILFFVRTTPHRNHAVTFNTRTKFALNEQEHRQKVPSLSPPLPQEYLAATEIWEQSKR